MSRDLEYLGVVHGDHCEIRDRSIVDLAQVLIYFISENNRPASALVIGGCRQRPEGDRCLGKHLHRKY